MNSKRLLKRSLHNKDELVPYLYQIQQPSLMQNQFQNWSCVLDPAIALSHHGVIIAENLSKQIELWIVQELWNIVNEAEFYSERTELITPNAVATEKQAVVAEIIWSLKEWQKTKQETDLAKLGMYWLGDNLQESLLPKNKPVEFFKQWEVLASTLDRRVRQTQSENNNILSLAFRDTLSLTASLKSAFVLTYQSSTNSRDSPPAICQALSNWGIPCQVINKRNPIVAMERHYIRQLIVGAGLGKLLLAGVNLVAFHLVIPAVSTSANLLSYTSLPTSEQQVDRESYFWNNVRGVWYYL